MRRWALLLNPENLELMVYAVLAHAPPIGTSLEDIADAAEALLDEDQAAHRRMMNKMDEGPAAAG